MSELAVKLHQDLQKKFDHLCFIQDQTALYVANQFYEMRNKIDIDAEELLASPKESQIEEKPKEVVKNTDKYTDIIKLLSEFKEKHQSTLATTNTFSSMGKIDNDLEVVIANLKGRILKDADDDVKVNNRREDFIKILRELEQRCLNKLQKTNHPSSAETYCHFKQRIESLKECPGDRLEETYRELALELVEETYQLEKRLIGEETVFYVPSRDKKLGDLVHISGDRLRRHEVECLRNIRPCSYLLMRHEAQLHKHLRSHLKGLVCVEYNPQIIVDNNYLIMIRLVYQLHKVLKTPTSKYIYMGKPELQYSGNAAKKSIIETQLVAYRLPSSLEGLQLEKVAGISSDLGVLSFSPNELSISESTLASLDFLATSPADQLESLALNDIRLECFDANLFSNCVNLKKLKLDIYGENHLFTSLEFLRPLRKLASLDLSLPNFDMDLSVLKDSVFLTALTLRSARDSTGKATYPKMNLDIILRQLCGLSSLTDLVFGSVEIDKISRLQFSGFKSLKKVTFFDTTGCKQVSKSGKIRKSNKALSSLVIKFTRDDLNTIRQLMNLLGY